MDMEQAVPTFDESLVQHKDFGFLVVPKRLRYSPAHPFYFGPWTRFVFGSGCAFIVANMYYCQPLLIQMSIDFQTTYADVSMVPTLYLVGYCFGLLLISPLGDLLRRRQLILALVTITTCLSVGLVLSTNFLVFQTFAFLLGVFNVTPQILIPFAADLSSPKHREAAVSVLQSGIMLGILLARVAAGIIAYFFHWRVVYCVSIGVQLVVLCGTYLLVPDQPPKNPDLTYLDIFYTMTKYAVTEPRLIQAVFINVASIACWSNFWVTLTFFLGGPPYNYPTLYIGLFGLVGVVGVLAGPLFQCLSRRYGPWWSLLAATFCLLLLQSVETAAAGVNIAVVVIFCIGLNAFRQSQTVSLQTIVLGISENSRSRLNAILTLSLSAGQAMGTSVGSQVFLTCGWRAASALSMAFYGWQLFVLFLRGPNCKRYTWFGYEGGFANQVEQTQDDIATPATQTSSVHDNTCSNLNRVERENAKA